MKDEILTGDAESLIHDDLWLDLVVSLLGVNQYSLEKTYEGRHGLSRESLTSPDTLAQLSVDEIQSRLCLAGYDRGPFMTRLFASRLQSLGISLHNGSGERLRQALELGDIAKVRVLLLSFTGVGPRVVANFLMLRGLSDSPLPVGKI